MKKIFITYGTTEGQIAKIAEFIFDVLRDHGHDVTMVDVKDTADTVPDGYDGPSASDDRSSAGQCDPPALTAS